MDDDRLGRLVAHRLQHARATTRRCRRRSPAGPPTTGRRGRARPGGRRRPGVRARPAPAPRPALRRSASEEGGAAITSSPASPQASARWRPANPVAPVMKTRRLIARVGCDGGGQLSETTYSADPWPLEAASAGSIGFGSESGGFRRRSSSPSTMPNSRWRQVAWANARPEPHSSGRSPTRVDAREPRGARPGREVLRQPGQRAAQHRRDRQRARRVGVDRPEHGAVDDVHRQPDRIRRATVGDEAPEQLDVVVRNVEHALVERLLGGPHGRRRGAGESAPEGTGSVERHESDCNAPARLGVRKRRGGVTHPMDLNAFHARVRTKGVNPIVYWLMRAWLQPFAHLYWRLSRIGREHVPAERAGDLRLQPPLVHRPVHPRPLQPPAGLLRGQGGAVQVPPARLVPVLARRVPGPPRRRRRGHDRDRQGDPQARRPGPDLPRGHAHPPGRAGQAQARRRPAGARDRRDGRPGRDARHRDDPQGHPDPPAQDPRAHRRAAEVPAGRFRDRPARRRGHRPHLAQRDAPVGVARRPAAAAPGRDHRRFGASRSRPGSPAPASRST